MADVPRVNAEEARRNVMEGRALLVCGYDDEAKCRHMLLDGAITMSSLQARLAALPQDTELIFYCG
jgi:hypothetical protein